MQCRRHVNAGVVVICALKTDIAGLCVSTNQLQEIPKGYATPFSNSAPALNANMPGDLRNLRQGPQLREAHRRLVGNHAAEFQRVTLFLNCYDLVLRVIGIEGKRVGDVSFSIDWCRFVRIKNGKLYIVIPFRHGR